MLIAVGYTAREGSVRPLPGAQGAGRQRRPLRGVAGRRPDQRHDRRLGRDADAPAAGADRGADRGRRRRPRVHRVRRALSGPARRAARHAAALVRVRGEARTLGPEVMLGADATSAHRRSLGRPPTGGYAPMCIARGRHPPPARDRSQLRRTPPGDAVSPLRTVWIPLTGATSRARTASATAGTAAPRSPCSGP